MIIMITMVTINDNDYIIIFIQTKSHSVWINIIQTIKNMCMFVILPTLKRVMGDIKANYKYTTHSDVNSFTHHQNLLEMFETHSMPLSFHQFRSSNLNEGFKNACTLFDIITIA